MIVIVPCGGLGNLLFQHAAGWAHAKEQCQELAALGWYPDTWMDRPRFGQYSKLFQHVKILGDGSAPYHEQWPGSPSQLQYVSQLSGERAVWSEQGMRYKPIREDARILTGYFQSWKYFDKYRLEIRDILRANESDIFTDQKYRFSGGVCVHVRWGGDGLSKFTVSQPSCTKEYYHEAMKLFPNNKFLLFCEEPDLVKDFAGPNVEIIHEPDPLKTLFLMSLCDHFIIANSTLSLMAYYMREHEDARLVAPKNWYKPGGHDYDISDILKGGTLL